MVDYFYYRLYRFFTRVENNLTPSGIRMPEYLAYIFFCFVLAINIITLDLLQKFRSGRNILLSSKMSVILIALIIFVVVFFLFLFKHRFQSIIEKYEHESGAMRTASVVFSLVYIFGSLGLLIFSTIRI